MLTVTVPPLSTLLCKLVDVKEELGIDSADTSHDHILNRLIAEASEIIQWAIGRDLGLATYSETVEGYGSSYLMVSRRPIVTLTGVTFRGATVADAILDDPRAGIIRRDFGFGSTAFMMSSLSDYVGPGTEAPWFTVNYTAGYVLPNDPGTPNMPLVFQRCAIETVVDWYTSAGESMRIQSKSVNGLTLTYSKEAQEKGLPLTVLCRLEKLKAYA